MSRLNTDKIRNRISVRIKRPWRGYSVGSVIKPPAAARQILLQRKDQLGNPIAELVEEPVKKTVKTTVKKVAQKVVGIAAEKKNKPNKNKQVQGKKNRRR